MTDEQTVPEDWVLLKGAEKCRIAWKLSRLRSLYADEPTFRALCDMIARYEEPPVDPDREEADRVVAGMLVEMTPDAVVAALKESAFAGIKRGRELECGV